MGASEDDEATDPRPDIVKKRQDEVDAAVNGSGITDIDSDVVEVTNWSGGITRIHTEPSNEDLAVVVPVSPKKLSITRISSVREPQRSAFGSEVPGLLRSLADTIYKTIHADAPNDEQAQDEALNMLQNLLLRFEEQKMRAPVPLDNLHAFEFKRSPNAIIKGPASITRIADAYESPDPIPDTIRKAYIERENYPMDLIGNTPSPLVTTNHDETMEQLVTALQPDLTRLLDRPDCKPLGALGVLADATATVNLKGWSFGRAIPEAVRRDNYSRPPESRRE